MVKEKRKVKGKEWTARANVVIDEIDILILNILNSDKETSLEELRKEIGISDPSLVLHLKRLHSHEFIQIRTDPKEWRKKIVRLVPAGKQAYLILSNSPTVASFINQEYLEDVFEGKGKS